MNGILLIDKQPDCTSHDVVAQARKFLGTRAVGHAGTLDPLATGLLCLLVGEATKLSDYLLNGDKSYLVTARFGIETDSLDRTGEVTQDRRAELAMMANSELTRQAQRISADLKGALHLKVPAFSAVKQAGEKLYEKARRAEAIDLPVREMIFHQADFIGPVEGKQHEYQWLLKCSKGSYVRSWVQELGRRLGFGATVSELRRIRSEPFSVEDAVNLSELRCQLESGTGGLNECLGRAWLSMVDALPHFGKVNIHGRDVQLLRNGQISQGLQGEILRKISFNESSGDGPNLMPIRVVDSEERQLVALLTANPGEFYKIKRVFRPI